MINRNRPVFCYESDDFRRARISARNQRWLTVALSLTLVILCAVFAWMIFK